MLCASMASAAQAPRVACVTRRQMTARKTSELKKHTVFIWAHVTSLVSNARAVGDFVAAESLLDEVSATPMQLTASLYQCR